MNDLTIQVQLLECRYSAAPVIAAGALTGLALKTVLDSCKSPRPSKQEDVNPD